ncbi:MAG: hypothetical protein ACKVQK_22505 [Burkholderiales bacterium]
MARLGDRFPADHRRAFVEKKLVPGCIVRIEVKFPEITKPKFLVLVADDDPDYCLFVVNSTIHPFITAHPHLLKCQVKIDVSGHGFLKRDSYLACDKLIRLRRADVLREITANVGAIEGQISDSVKDQVIAAVKFATTLSNAEKAKILGSMNA